MKFSRPFFKRQSALIAVFIAAAIVLWSVPAAAAGFFLPTRGVEASSRGGASIAPHDAALDSIWYNPAGLSLNDEFQLDVDVAVVDVRSRFYRAPRQMQNGDVLSYDPVQNQASPNVIPKILVGGSTPHPDIGWALGLYTPYAAGGRYPEDGPQRYVLVDNVGSTMGYVHAAIGWSVNERLSFGAGLQNFMGEFRIVAMGSGYTGIYGDPEDRDLDMLAIATLSDRFSPTANVGTTFAITDRIHTGLSLQLPHLFRDSDATLETRMPDHPAYDNAEATDDTISLSVPFPFQLRGGLRFVDPRFFIEASLVYQHWSLFDEVVVDPGDAEITGLPGVGTVPVQAFTFPQEYRNTISVHLGGEYNLGSDLDLRAGYVFERSAVPDHRYSVFALDPDKHQLTAGAGVGAGPVDLNVVAGAIIMPSRQISNSEVRQINPADPDDEYTIVVGNGRYEHFGYLFGLGVQYGF